MLKIDWLDFEKTLLGRPQPTVLDFSRVAGEFRKVAFDVYRHKDGDPKLWELREGDDGKKYLYALYDENTSSLTSESSDAPEELLPTKKASTSSIWHAMGDSAGENVTLFYRDHPIYRFAGSAFQFEPSSAAHFATFVAHKAASEPSFIAKLSGTMSPEKRAYLNSLMTTADGDANNV